MKREREGREREREREGKREEERGRERKREDSGMPANQPAASASQNVTSARKHSNTRCHVLLTSQNIVS